MKFEDIRITAKTGGGQEMTLKHMFQGMAPTIKEIAGEGQGEGVTEQRVNELVGAAVDPLAQQASSTASDLSNLDGKVDQIQGTVGENATSISALQTSVSELTQAVEDAQQELIDVKQQNAALEARLAALEAGANAN